jgi:hypothetical protein
VLHLPAPRHKAAFSIVLENVLIYNIDAVRFNRVVFSKAGGIGYDNRSYHYKSIGSGFSRK